MFHLTSAHLRGVATGEANANVGPRRTMSSILILILLASLSADPLGKEDCSLEAIGLSLEDDIAHRLFYTGTCHYRNQDYEKSAAAWEQLANMEDVSPESQSLRVDVLNNLGYLKFFGYGIREDKEQALDYWKMAISLGHYESEYHLCHAYADSDQPTFNRGKAEKHCEKAYLIYNGMEERTESEVEILRQIREYRAQM